MLRRYYSFILSLPFCHFFTTDLVASNHRSFWLKGGQNTAHGLDLAHQWIVWLVEGPSVLTSPGTGGSPGCRACSQFCCPQARSQTHFLATPAVVASSGCCWTQPHCLGTPGHPPCTHHWRQDSLRQGTHPGGWEQRWGTGWVGEAGIMRRDHGAVTV